MKVPVQFTVIEFDSDCVMSLLIDSPHESSEVQA